MYQARSAVLLSPHLLRWGGLCHFQHYTSSMHSHHNLVDDCNVCDECGPMRVPHFCALDPPCRELLEILHLRVSFLDRLRDIQLFARSVDPRIANTQGTDPNPIDQEIQMAYPVQIWSLHANTARKSGLTGVFGLATMLVTCPIYLRQCDTASQMLTSPSGLAASAVRMATYIHLTEGDLIPHTR